MQHLHRIIHNTCTLLKNIYSLQFANYNSKDTHNYFVKCYNMRKFWGGGREEKKNFSMNILNDDFV